MIPLILLTATASAEAPSTPAIIPQPTKVVVGQGHFSITPSTKILVVAKTKSEGDLLAQYLASAMGFKLEVVTAKGAQPKNSILLAIDDKLASFGAEGYALSAKSDKVVISAPKPAGVFYATQTLRQLLPTEVYGKSKATGVDWRIPAIEVEDTPRYPWRGSLLDCCRHFWTVDFVKRYIDLLAMHKMNRFHWHLTEDQGWRIEIKKYPKLAEISAWRDENGTRYGGYYSQAQIRDVVKYAAERHIEVVPEIELPGHSVAALAAYPELSCKGGPFKVETHWGVFEDVYCAGNDKTFDFLENVLTEVTTLFPSKYVHIGGDECPKESWKKCPKCQARIKSQGLKDENELQNYFVSRIEKFLNSKGKSIIGWDEILEGGLAPNATVQSWRGIQGGIHAAKLGHDVVMSPYSHCYLDYSNDTYNLSLVYSYEPTPTELNAQEAKHVLGVEGNMWTEGTPNESDIDRQVFPRLSALSEVGWSPKAQRNEASFMERMKAQFKRYDAIGVKYFVDPYVGMTQVGTWKPADCSATEKTFEWDVTSFLKAEGSYEFVILYKSGEHGLAIKSAALFDGDTELSVDKHEAFSGGRKTNISFLLNLPSAPKAGAKIMLKVKAYSDGGTDSAGVVLVRKK